MGDLIQFPIKPKPPEDDKAAQLRRIQESLRKLNELMRRIKDAQDRGKGSYD